MLNPTRGLNWVSRALILSFACVGITLVAHALAGGAVPLVGILLVSLLMTLGALFAIGSAISWAMAAWLWLR